MTTPYYADDSITLWHGDALKVLRTLPDHSIDCCVTSPPYFGLRDYGETGQYGLEETPAAYVETLSPVFAEVPDGRNPGDVWSVPTQPFAEAHFAVMPAELAERAIKAGCKPGGTVLDPFSGSGTTGYAAARLGRQYVGIDLSADFLALSLRTRLNQIGAGL